MKIYDIINLIAEIKVLLLGIGKLAFASLTKKNCQVTQGRPTSY